MPGPLRPRDAGAVTDLVRSGSAADGVAAIGDHLLDRLREANSTRYVLVHSSTTELIAAAVLPVGDPAELLVAPGHRRAGLGRALLRAVLKESSAVWAHGDLPAAKALAEAEQLRPTRELLQMSRPLGDPLPVVLPPGVGLRTFLPGFDDEAFLAVNARAFAWHPEQGRLDATGLRGEMAQDWFDPAGFFLAVDADDRVLGFHWTKVHRLDLGEVYVLGVDPLSPVRRLGEPLTVAGLNYLAARGVSSVMLYVEGDNGAALRLYRRLGFQVSGVDRVYRAADPV